MKWQSVPAAPFTPSPSFAQIHRGSYGFTIDDPLLDDITHTFTTWHQAPFTCYFWYDRVGLFSMRWERMRNGRRLVSQPVTKFKLYESKCSLHYRHGTMDVQQYACDINSLQCTQRSALTFHHTYPEQCYDDSHYVQSIHSIRTMRTSSPPIVQVESPC